MLKILITAGPTREPIDPVRYISNRSSGRMGYAIAEAAIRLGHEVTLISGPVSIPRPEGLSQFVPVTTAAEMYDAVTDYFPEADLTIMCAAVADYTPAHTAPQKIKKNEDEFHLILTKTRDILATLGTMKKKEQILVGFAAETENLMQNAQSKMVRKNLDYIAANDVSGTESGFDSLFNALTVFRRNGEVCTLPLMSKTELADALLSLILNENRAENK